MGLAGRLASRFLHSKLTPLVTIASLAAGLIALEEMPRRLHEDHENARWLAGELAKIPGIALDPAKVATNIVVFNVTRTGKTSAEISRCLAERSVLINGIEEIGVGSTMSPASASSTGFLCRPSNIKI